MDYKINKPVNMLTEGEVYTHMWNLDGLDRESFTDVVFGKRAMNIPLKTKVVNKKVATNDGHEFVKYIVGLHNQLNGNVSYDLTKYYFPGVINRAVSRVVTNTLHQVPYYDENGQAKNPSYDLSDVAMAYASLPDEYMDKDVLLSFFADSKLTDEYAEAGTAIISRVLSKFADKLRPSEVVRFLPYIKEHASVMREDMANLNDEKLVDEASSMIYDIAKGKNLLFGDIDKMYNRLAEVGSDYRNTVLNNYTNIINMYSSFLGKFSKTPVIVEAYEELQNTMYFIHSQQFEDHAKGNDEIKRNLVDVVRGRLSKSDTKENKDQPSYNRHDALKSYISAKKTQEDAHVSQVETIVKKSNTNHRSGM